LHGSTVRPCGGRRPWQIRASGVTCVNDGDHRLRRTQRAGHRRAGGDRPVADRRGVLRAHVGRLSHPCYGPASRRCASEVSPTT
jgi:hypothetical protein